MPQAIKFSVRRATSEHARMPEVVPPSYVRYALAGVKIGSLLDRTRSYPGPATTVQIFIDEWVVPSHRDYVVVDDGEVAGIVSMARVRSVRKQARATTTLRSLLRARVPHAFPDELIVDVMDRMTSNSMTVIPVKDRDSGRFLGTLASHEVLDLVALMDEIKEEEKAMGAATETVDA
jgi:CBS domain-containing protein